MNPLVTTKDPTAVEMHVQQAYQRMFAGANPLFVPQVFGWAIECFTGNYRDYQAIDARYHDFEHTLQGTLCMARILAARHVAGVQPTVSQREFQLGLIAILLHDSGYLKKQGDDEGTGAKYTVTHVARSATFAGELLMSKQGFTEPEIRSVQNMILCTGVAARLSTIQFQSQVERILGCTLATADLLGQMAAEDYVEKLPSLYLEFAEANRFTGDPTHFIASFQDPADLVRRTPAFWEQMVLPKLQTELEALYRFLNDPYPDGPNPYLLRIEENLRRIK